MGPSDLDGVMAIEEVSFPTPWSPGMFLEDFPRDFSDTLVAAGTDDEVLGYAVCWTLAGESHLLNIAVHPERRGQGIGRALLSECIRRAARAGASLIFLEVRAGNEAAQRLYRSMGFVFRGIRKGYYTDTREDAVILDREVRKSDAAG
ncbi:MAG: ribosomal protein S18-alanine N-acetyltransferase [Deltaproteobacteria bacterium]|uniref:ribosomal protein S18-alanine N-acetyltransferase n=1 Tax=Candidatus Deferrimicrobium sp. TaxID=3060586 RepID=UPI00272D3F18|nr:ribosomal protein S18-alanine N-acetyltransferase [Candidatus Deferrimicrobium sp.]MCR4310817.1 ribosomal protein S18-alanine N-acetyltransferase [Deltaproteobacteria bacterium]